jgi:hypothetical protein
MKWWRSGMKAAAKKNNATLISRGLTRMNADQNFTQQPLVRFLEKRSKGFFLISVYPRSSGQFRFPRNLFETFFHGSCGKLCGHCGIKQMKF